MERFGGYDLHTNGTAIFNDDLVDLSVTGEVQVLVHRAGAVDVSVSRVGATSGITDRVSCESGHDI